MIKALVIDDEKKSRESLAKLIETFCTGIKVTGDADGVATGVTKILEEQPDLVFLDIRMRDGTGFDLLQKLPRIDFQLIFVTAYDEFALRAFKFNAVDYLLKPIDVEELEASVERARAKIRSRTHRLTADVLANLTGFNAREPRITIATDDTIEFVLVRDIIRLVSDGGYTEFHTVGGRKLIASRHLKVYDDLLEEYAFIRVHHSHLININHIERF
ncbi:MAG: LytTR family DNA-binding domain-containing protein, partial [Saprospiraceae bacterium]|nr:LytTR family DNA-binding domain-containing protein [Saprospiraceae bacterium]